jgi:hypothetical protein
MNLKYSAKTRSKYNLNPQKLPYNYQSPSRQKDGIHTYTPTEDRNYKVVLTHLHYSASTEDRTLIKQARTNIPLSMFFVDQNNKDIYNVEYLYQCKVKFETLSTKGT